VLQITFMRHGKPLLATARWLAPSEMAQWIAQYNRSEVAAFDIPATSMHAATSASVIVASSAPRALSSVQALGHEAAVADAIFLEAELPFALWRFPKLPPHVWAAFFRLLWLLGYARGADTVQATRTRAKAAAGQLIAAARTGPVVLVGHGIMNRLIAKELLGSGWVAATRHASTYWSTSVYRLPDELAQ
jgi:broad specificity phosphatase PhoE